MVHPLREFGGAGRKVRRIPGLLADARGHVGEGAGGLLEEEHGEAGVPELVAAFLGLVLYRLAMPHLIVRMGG